MTVVLTCSHIINPLNGNCQKKTEKILPFVALLNTIHVFHPSNQYNTAFSRAAVGMGIPMGIPIGIGMGWIWEL